jgi:hypothetical protein
MPIERLTQRMPPPAKPTAARGDWTAIEAALQVGLPADYKAFIAQYGAGNVGDFIHVWSPFSDEPHLSLLAQVHKETEGLRGLRHARIPHPIYPAKNALLPWGRTDNSDILMWLTSGAPDQWRVVVTDGSDFYEMDVGFADFLAGVLDKTIACPAFPDDVPPAGPKFFPAR